MAQSPLETLRWHGNALELIDQRALPRTATYVRCQTAVEVARAIADMVVRGAPAIGCAAAYGYALAACEAEAQGLPLIPVLDTAYERLISARPTAVNLRWALDRMRRIARVVASGPAPGQALVAEAARIQAEDLAANLAMGAQGAALLPPQATVLTHCNAGALATTGHGTALGVIRSAVAQGKRINVIANETRPFLQGARLTAWELQQSDIPVTLIPDSASGHLMSRGEIDAVVVGADRVAANGDVANKIGTYQIAVLARRHDIPFYVACPLSTIDPTVADGRGIPIEERAGAEMLGYADVVWAPDGVAVRNPAFDVTPADLVTALVTERGVARMPYGPSIASLLASADG